MDIKQEFREETDMDVYASYGNNGSFNNVYVKWLEAKLTLTDVGFTLPRPLEAWNEAQKLDIADYIDWHLEKEKGGN